MTAAGVRRDEGRHCAIPSRHTAGQQRAMPSRYGYEKCDVARWAAAKRKRGIPIRLVESAGEAETGGRAPWEAPHTLECHKVGRRPRY